MTSFEDRIAALEDAQESIAGALQAMQEQLTTLLAHSASNGGLSVIIRDRRIRFSGSVPVPWTLGVLGLGVGLIGLSKVSQVW